MRVVDSSIFKITRHGPTTIAALVLPTGFIQITLAWLAWCSRGSYESADEIARINESTFQIQRTYLKHLE